MHSARQANSTDSAAKRMIMWDIYMAGGFGTWYNCDTAWCVIIDSAEAQENRTEPQRTERV